MNGEESIFLKTSWILTRYAHQNDKSSLVVVFARPPTETCCQGTNDCVYGGHCVSSDTSPYDVDGDDDKDYCLNSEWWDCGSDGYPSTGCSQSSGRGWYCQNKDCYERIKMCLPCSNNYECLGGSCTSGKCRTTTNEAGAAMCSDGIDNDCEGGTDCADTSCASACCGVEGASCSNDDSQCCGAMPCDYPVENQGTKCGCPDGFDWWGPPTNDCVFTEEDCTAPPSNCDTNPYQTGCIRDSPFPFSSTDGCCVFGSYGGTTYYDWDIAHITTY